MPRGDPHGNLNIIAEGYELGFGLLKGVAVDQHFFVRKRLADMTQLVATYPQLLGIGIDERTVIIDRGASVHIDRRIERPTKREGDVAWLPLSGWRQEEWEFGRSRHFDASRGGV